MKYINKIYYFILRIILFSIFSILLFFLTNIILGLFGFSLFEMDLPILLGCKEGYVRVPPARCVTIEEANQLKLMATFKLLAVLAVISPISFYLTSRYINILKGINYTFNIKNEIIYIFVFVIWYILATFINGFFSVGFNRTPIFADPLVWLFSVVYFLIAVLLIRRKN